MTTAQETSQALNKTNKILVAIAMALNILQVVSLVLGTFSVIGSILALQSVSPSALHSYSSYTTAASISSLVPLFWACVVLFIIWAALSVLTLVWSIKTFQGKMQPTVGRGIFMIFTAGIVGGILYIIAAVNKN